MNADEVVTTDLDSIVDQLADELPHLSGRNVLIAGGAGFLGHYLVQTALRWNVRNRSAPPITVTVLDNFIRDIPPWLTALADNPQLRLRSTTLHNRYPRNRRSISYSCRIHCLANLLPQAPDRNHGRKCEWLALHAGLLPRAKKPGRTR